MLNIRFGRVVLNIANSFYKVGKCRIATQAQLLNDSIIPTSKSGNLTLVSLSKNIYYNLAIEQYIADNYDFENRNILFLWQNEPCVVIGRYQNPWQECDLVEMEKRNVLMARRHSGGGCVYHDLGNLNCTFFSNRQKFDRPHNLGIMKRAMEKCNFERIKFQVSPRHDMVIENADSGDNKAYKVTGSSSKLSKNYAYHHCTLLLDADISNMKLLRTNLTEEKLVESKATLSVRAECRNLKEFNENLQLNRVIEIMAKEYWDSYWNKWSIENLFNYINPESEPIKKLMQPQVDQLSSWQFIYGNTPKFQLKVDIDKENDKSYLRFFIENGRIVSIDTFNLNYRQLDKFTTHAYLLHGARLDRTELHTIFHENNLDDDRFYKHLYKFFSENL